MKISTSTSTKSRPIAFELLDAHTYRQHSTVQSSVARKVWDQLTLQGNEHLLDIGCGDGQLTQMMARALPHGHATGTDLSPSMIAVANDHSLPNLQFEVRDIHALGAVAQYDLITAFSSLHWVPRLDQAISRIHRALKPGGRFVAITYSPEAGIHRIAWDLLSTPRWRHKVRHESAFSSRTASEHMTILDQFEWTHSLEQELIPLLSSELMQKNFEVFAPLLINGSANDRLLLVEDLLAQLHHPAQSSALALTIFAQKEG